MITKLILRLKNKDSKFMQVSSFKDNQLLSPLVILASWTGRYEAHLWDKNCWNESQNKKGRQDSISLLSSYYSILVPMMMKKLLLKDKQPLYWWFEWDDVTM
ncbi:uncharacterized protein LOC114260051 isoform X1 [Camellia sinensis]|uniref:uncharacterized protein LOC114260051 isoform X1 n=1 Tax=Camellia sinensis TaxID=4442 RepID=UPI001036412D|nr:uncharacterized protein LOC114260051 isoform X1 [Camellia sinensis]XP_028055910.1 uncharacterized protein LOC114260051 isoform X1 [Camellia sinensis]XP_028055911.1 uncharacterized protein LOC114260051 isoform X1 [Camellia sinensis]